MPLAVSLCAAPAARPRRVAARRRSARACATPDAQTVRTRTPARAALLSGPSLQPSGSCPSCGVAKANMKCDGSGRQQGGIGAVPGFTWWPIKVSGVPKACGALR